MDQRRSLDDSIHTRLRIYPSRQFITFLNTLPDEEEIPGNILKVIDRKRQGRKYEQNAKPKINRNDDDVRNMKRVNEALQRKLASSDLEKGNNAYNKGEESKHKPCSVKDGPIERAGKVSTDKKTADFENGEIQVHYKHYLTSVDIDWVHNYLQGKKDEGIDVPYLHVFLEGAKIDTPKNKVVERNPELEARCHILRAQQEAKEYNTVSLKIAVEDLNMKMKHFEVISYQRHKQLHTPFAFGNWNKYVHKRIKAGEKEKEHQD